MRLPVLLLAVAGAGAAADVHTLTLRQAIDLALKQSPDILIARFEERKAAESAREARDPFTPKLFAGSGLAYTSGFPMSIEGSAPSIFQARAIQTFYNRPLSFQVAAAKENARGAEIVTAARREEAVHNIANLHLAAARAARVGELVRQQVASSESIAAAVRARVEEGRELPVEGRAAELRAAQARQRVRTLEAERDYAEHALAAALGFGPDDRVVAALEDPAPNADEPAESAAIDQALANSKQIRQLESALQAEQLRAHGARSMRYPQVDLVAQYAVMAKFNRFQDFFQRFQRNNWQLGVSFQLPVFPGGAGSAQAARAEAEMARLRAEINAARSRISTDARRSWQEYRNAQSARELSRLDLDLVRERLSVALAQMEEGRASLRQVEELRSAEAEKWVAFYDAQHAAERARLELLRQTGSILTAGR